MPLGRRLPFPFDTKRVYTEISDLAHGSTIQHRGRALVASVPSGKPDGKGRKKVTGEERKALVESFVDRYRAVNLGKFPTVTNAQKEVGGSYYTVKKIIQELEHRSRLSSVDTVSKGLLGQKLDKGKERSSEEVAISQRIFESSSEIEEVSSSQKTIGDSSNQGAVEDHFSKASAVSYLSSKKSEHNIEENAAQKDVQELDASKPNADQHGQPELNKSARNLSERREDEDLQTKPSLWESVKSLADGFISMWRKM